MIWAKLPQKVAPSNRDWYYDADPAQRREYDAFGPWIGVVRTLEDMPPRFRHAFEELCHSDFLYKIPIKADRRAMRPGMDLYRAVLAVNDARVVVLEWDGARETRHESAVKDIQAIRIDQDLLSATLSLLQVDGQTVVLSYSTVSDKEIGQVVSFLRGRMLSQPSQNGPIAAPVPANPEIDIDDSFYYGMWWKHTRSLPSAQVLYWENPGVRLGRLRSSLGSLVMGTDDELVMIHHGQFVRRWLEAVYSVTEIFVPWSSVLSARLIQDPKSGKRPHSTVEIAVQGHVIQIASFVQPDRPQGLISGIEAKHTPS